MRDEHMSDNGASGADLLKTHIALGARLLSFTGHDDFNQGQISGRLANDDRLFIKNGWTGFQTCEPGDIIECLLPAGAKLPLDAPAETCLHQAIYHARPDVLGCVHTHHEAAVALGAVSDEIMPISHEGAYFHDNTAVFDWTSHTILSRDDAERVAARLGGNSAVILRNHGFLTVGPSVKSATLLAIMFARACRIQLAAFSSGRHIHTSSLADVSKKRSFIYSNVALRSYWKTLSDALLRAQPEAARWMKSSAAMSTLQARTQPASQPSFVKTEGCDVQ